MKPAILTDYEEAIGPRPSLGLPLPSRDDPFLADRRTQVEASQSVDRITPEVLQYESHDLGIGGLFEVDDDVPLDIDDQVEPRSDLHIRATMLEEAAAAIREEIERQGLTGKAAAGITAVSPSYISAVVNGKSSGTVATETLEEMLGALRISPETAD